MLTNYFSSLQDSIKHLLSAQKGKNCGVNLLPSIQKIPSLLRKIPSLLDRRHLVFVHDLFMSGFALFLTFLMRFGDDFSLLSSGFITKHIVVFGLVSACIFLWLQSYRGIWRYISTHEIMGTIFAAGYATALYFPLMVLMSTSSFIPRTTIFLLFLVTSFLLLSTRITYRFTQIKWLDDDGVVYQNKPASRVLLVGSLQEISHSLKGLKHEKNPSFTVLGALSPHQTDTGRFVEGIEILGRFQDLENIVEHFNLEDKHPHSLVLLGKKNSNFQTLQTLAPQLPRLGLNLMRFSEGTKKPFDLEPFSYKNLSLPDTQPSLSQESVASPTSKTLLSKKRILLFGAEQLVGQNLSERLLSQGQENIFLSDLSSGFVNSFQGKSKSFSDEGIGFLPLPGTTQEDFQDVLTEVKPDLILVTPPLVSESYFKCSPSRAIDVIHRYMFSLLKANLASEPSKIVIIFPCNFFDFTYRYIQRYFNILQAEMCHYILTSGTKTDLFFLYTGEFAESPDSLLNSIKESLENEESPILRKDLQTYEFSSLDRISEKIIDYLLRLFILPQDAQVETHLRPDMVSTPEELLDQIKALYPLPYKAQTINFLRSNPTKERIKFKPFVVQKSPKENRYLITNTDSLKNISNNIKKHIQNKNDKEILRLLS